MVWLRALAVWCLIFAAEAVHGILRTLLLVPRIGDMPSRQFGVVIGSVLIVGIAWLTVRWIGARGTRQWLSVGVLWTLLMVATEVLLGRAAFGYPWERITEDFDPTRGGLLGFGMAVMLLAPVGTAWVRGLFGRRPAAREASGEGSG